MRGAPLPDFGTYEETTRLPLYRGQEAPVARWIRGRVLDLGSHVGRFSRLSQTAVSLEIEGAFLRRGIELGNIANPVRASAVTLPFKTASFDTLLAIGILEHVPMALIPGLLDEATRVARAHARMIARVISPISPVALYHVPMWSDHVHPYSPLRLRAELRTRGWRPLAVMSSGIVGLRHTATRTVDAFVPWAVHVHQVFARTTQARAPR